MEDAVPEKPKQMPKVPKPPHVSAESEEPAPQLPPRTKPAASKGGSKICSPNPNTSDVHTSRNFLMPEAESKDNNVNPNDNEEIQEQETEDTDYVNPDEEKQDQHKSSTAANKPLPQTPVETPSIATQSLSKTNASNPSPSLSSASSRAQPKQTRAKVNTAIGDEDEANLRYENTAIKEKIALFEVKEGKNRLKKTDAIDTSGNYIKPQPSKKPHIPSKVDTLGDDTAERSTRRQGTNETLKEAYDDIAKINGTLDELDQQMWYFGNRSREECEECLKSMNQDGSFMVRRSQRGGEKCPYVLVLVQKGQVYNLLLRQKDPNTFALGFEKKDEPVFSGVVELISFYRINPITMNTDSDKFKVKLTKSPPK